MPAVAFCRVVHVAPGRHHRLGDAVGRHHDAPGLVALGLGQGDPEQRPQVGPRVGVVQGHQGRERVDPLGQVLARRLLQLAVGGGDVEDVVTDLEHHAEAVPELGAGVDFGRGKPAGQRADAARGGGERCCLAADGGEVVLAAAVDLESRAHLRDLSLTEPAQRVRQQLCDIDAEAGRDGGAPGQEEVAGHDGHEVPETAVDALDVAPDGRLVDDIVVVQGGEVDQLHRHPAHQVVLGGLAAARRGRRQREQGSKPLAPGCDQVGRDLVQKGVACDNRGSEQGFQSPQSLLQAG